MVKILKTKSIYYKDVNLIAQKGIVESRSEIPKRLDLIFVSPMAAICGEKFVKEALDLGLSVCLHRFCNVTEQGDLWCSGYNVRERVWAAIGLNDNTRLHYLYSLGCKNFILDVANGYQTNVLMYAEQIYNYYKDINLMVGNIHSKLGMKLYKNIPNVKIRVGIANGLGCNTAGMTSINRGQITEIMECNENRNKNQKVLADGGISSPAYAALAFGCGADEIMLGGYFSRAEEAENVIRGEYKFWGSASHKQLELSGSKRKHSEGKILEVKDIKPLKVLVDELWGGISSAISYSGFNNINDFIGNATIELKYN